MSIMRGLVCAVVLVVLAVVLCGAECGMPTGLVRMLERAADTEPEAGTENFQELPKDSAVRQELDQDPGVPLGQLSGDPDVSGMREDLRRGDIFGRFRPSLGAEAAARRSLAAASASSDWSQFTPPPLTQVECHVEFQVTQRVPGRCTKLGGVIPACQSEKYVGINYSDCS